MSGPTKHVYEFGAFHVDPTERRLLRDGQLVPLPPKAFDTLVVLVQNSGHLLTKEQLLRTLWPETYVEENNLTQYVSALRKALGDDGNGGYIETVPRVGYRFATGVREVLNPAESYVVENRTKYRVVIREETYEETNDQSDESTSVEQQPAQNVSAPITRRFKQKQIVIAAAVGLVALVVAVMWATKARKNDGSGEKPTLAFKSIAVLPFKTIGDDDAHLGLGMADTLISKLSEVSKIEVRPISAVHTFTRLGQDPVATGRALRVDLIVDGRVQRADGRIRVTVELLSVDDSAVIWAETLDEKFTDVFAVQDAIADRVVSSLPNALTTEERTQLARRPTTSTEAYDAYLKGRFFWNKRTQPGFAKAVEHFREAIRLDPNYALAYAGLADCYALGADGLPIEAHTRRMKETVARALALDETLAEAHASLAYYVGAVEWDWSGAEQGFRRAIQLDPNYATAHHWYAYHLAAMGRLEESLAEIRRAQELDPLSLIINTDVGHILYFAGRFDEAIAQYRQVLGMDANFLQAHWRLGEAYLEKGMYTEAISEFNEVRRLGVTDALLLGWIGYAHAKMGRKNEAQIAITELKRGTNTTGPLAYRIAVIFTGLSDRERALDWLEIAYEANDTGEMALIKVDPLLKDLRNESRFQNLLSRMKLGGA